MATVVSSLLIHQQQQQQHRQQEPDQTSPHQIPYPIDSHRSSYQYQNPQLGNQSFNVQGQREVAFKSRYQDEYESHIQAHHEPRSTPCYLRPRLGAPPQLDGSGYDGTLDSSSFIRQSGEEEEEPSSSLTRLRAVSDFGGNHDDLASDLSSRLSYLTLSLPTTHNGDGHQDPLRVHRNKMDSTNGSNGSRGRRGRSSSVSLISGGAQYQHPHYTHAQHNFTKRWRSPYYHPHPGSSGSEPGEGGQRQGRRARARSQLCLPASTTLPVIEVVPGNVMLEASDVRENQEDQLEAENKPGVGIDFIQSELNELNSTRPGSELERGRTRANVTILEVPDSPPVSIEEGGFSSPGSEWSGTTSETEVEIPEEDEEDHMKERADGTMTALMEGVSLRNSSITPGKKDKRVRMGSRVRFEHLHHHSPSPHSLVHASSHTSTTRDKLFDPYTATIPTLTHLLQSSLITSAQIIETYLSQINLHNPTLRALTWMRERENILREARVCDLYRSRGWVDWERKPLWGVPIVVKDNIATEEELGMPTTAGSYALLGMPVKKDAFIVRKLREAGAIILAKANMSELADYKSAHAGAGWSAVGGQTINVYAAHASPGTSSSGNGVSVAAGFCPASIGTETDGSITLPCLQSCLYGLKPTVGMLSRSGVVPFAPYFDTPGPMAKDVKSLAILMDVMCAADEEDVKTLEVDRIPRGVKYIDSCNAPSFEGLRIGIPRANWHNIDPWRRPGRDELVPEIANPFEQVIEMMSINGAVVQDPADIPSAVDGSLWACSSGSRSLVVAADCNHYLGKYLENLGGSGGCRSVADIIAFNEEHADIEMPPGHHGQEVLKRCLDAVSVDSDEYASAKADMKLVAGKRGLDAVMDEYDLDALFMIREGHHSAANMVGYPIAAVPIGLLSDNTPYGAFFIGRKHGEQTLLRIMAAWEATFAARPLPPIATEA